MDTRIDTYDWEEVFGEDDAQNKMVLEAVPPGSDVSIAQVTRADVATVAALHEDADVMYGEFDGVGLFQLKDGRWLVARGWADTSGWGWQDGTSAAVAASSADAIRFGLTDGERAHLGLTLPED